MNTYITYDSSNQLVLVDNGITTPITKKIVSHGKEYWVLPNNSSNRQYVGVEKLANRLLTTPQVELTVGAPRTASGTTSTNYSNKQPLEKFLEGEERELFIKLRDKAIAKATIQVELERKRLAFEKAKAEYEALLNGSN